jgi:hypothetical protein
MTASGRVQLGPRGTLRLMAIRQAGLEPLALSASGRECMVSGPTAASEEKRIDFSGEIARFGAILKRKGPLVEIGPRSVFDLRLSAVGVRQ